MNTHAEKKEGEGRRRRAIHSECFSERASGTVGEIIPELLHSRRPWTTTAAGVVAVASRTHRESY